MRTVILTLKDAVETGLKDIDLLDKQDKVIFVYPKGKDSISIQVHTALAQLKCKVEFFEIQDENATKQDIPVYFAFLAGSNPNSVVIDTGSDLTKLSFLGIPRYQDFKSVVSKKAVNTHFKNAQPKKRTRKQSEEIDKTPIKADVMNPPEEVEKENQKKTPEPVPEAKPARKPRAKVSSSPSGTATMDDLKAFLQSNATEKFNPATMTMSIYEAITQNVLKGTPINQALKETIIIEAKVETVNNALQGKWGKVTDIVTGILKEKGKI